MKNSVAKGLIKTGASMLIWGAVLFLAAGRMDWPMAWAYMGVVLVNSAILALLMDPELQAERSGVGEGSRGGTSSSPCIWAASARWLC